jgi:two-component system nitrogen regulation response regulator NtrX
MSYDILIVDDQADIRRLASDILEDEGYQTRDAADRVTALAAIETRRPTIVLLDIWLKSPLEGIDILKIICAQHPNVPVVMMSGHGNIETAVSAINIGAFDFIEKPFTSDRLILVVQRAIENAELKRENEELKKQTGGDNDLIGNSNVISQLRQTIVKVASSNSRVLINGPAGSGKDIIARLLHRNSNRGNGPFVSLNCATMSPNNFEISLFGMASSGEGLSPREIGTFEQAHNGTLFLDEVADMPIKTQGKIVRVLQEQTFQPVNGSTFIEVDVRVIAASTKDLVQEMKQGNFREDLFYRLSVVPIEVPRLSDYREDIPALIEHFIMQIANLTGTPKRAFSEDAIAILQIYRWPGNVRELRNVIERILIMAPGDENDPIQPEMIPIEISNGGTLPQGGIDSGEFMTLPLREAREIFEREYLEKQVSRFGGNISKTANFIGMERSALHRKLKSLGFHSDVTTIAAND